MRIIFAESGQDFETKNRFSKTLSNNDLVILKQEIQDKSNVKAADQILLTTNGTQLTKDNLHKFAVNEEDTTVVLFNRILLQNPIQLYKTISNYKVQPNLIDSNSIPTYKEIEESFILALENNSDEEIENIGIINQLKNTIQTIIDSSVTRKSTIEKLTREMSLQSVALDSALNNMENHVRTAYQNIGKFDRIAQREFSKHEQVIARIQIDFELLKQIYIHPRILNNVVPVPDSANHSTLDQFVPIRRLETMQADIIKQYNILVQATLEQKNKVTWLNQQTANVSVNRTTSKMATDRVTKLKNECAQSMDAIIGLQKKMMGDFNRRRMAYGMDGSSTITIRPKKDVLQDAFRSLYLHMSHINDAENTIVEEKKRFVSAFIKCMQSISQVEESISQIYPKLANLEKRIKVLRVTIDKGEGAAAKKIIEGYGALLIEFWRRDRYSEIATKNASLLSDLFDQFGKREERYRRNFIENEIICLDDKQLLLSEDQEHAVVPFQIRDINESPILCQAFATPHANNYSNTITKSQVEDFIKMVHSFYQGKSNSSNEDTPNRDRDLSRLLKQKLERESKRLNKGLVKLGNRLPVSQLQQQPQKQQQYVLSQRNNTTSLSIDEESISAPLPSRSISTPTSTSISQYYTPEIASPLSSHHSPTVQSDWTTLSEEFKKNMDTVRLEREQDRTKFEKEKQNLLNELNAKDKLIQEIQDKHRLEIKELEKELRKTKDYHKLKEQELQGHFEHTLKLEQEKFEHRFLQRMQDKAYVSLEAVFLRESKSAPTSPPTSPLQPSFPEEHDVAIKLKQELKDQLGLTRMKEQGYVSQLQALTDDLRALKINYASRLKAENQNLAAEHTQRLNDLREAHEQRIEEKKHQMELEKKTREINKLKGEILKRKKEKTALAQQFSNLQRDHSYAAKFAKELLSMTGKEESFNNTSLVDLLKIAIGNVSNLQSRSNMLEQSIDSLVGLPYFGY